MYLITQIFMIRKLQFIFFLCVGPACISASGIGDHLDQLKTKCSEAQHLEEEVDALLELADYYREVLYENIKADSVYDIVFGKLNTSIDHELKFKAYKHFLDHIPFRYETPECRIACEQIIEVIDNYDEDDIYFDAHLAVGKASLKLGDSRRSSYDMQVKASDWAQSHMEAVPKKYFAKLLLGDIKTI